MNDTRIKLEERISRLSAEQRALLDRQLNKPRISGDELLAQCLKHNGVSHVYGVPGQGVYETIGEIAKLGIRIVSTRHQQPGAMMAAAHNYFAGTAEAVTVLCAGAAGLNALTGIAIAYENGWPLLALASTSPQTSKVDGYFMSMSIEETFRPITKAVIRVNSSEEIPGSIQKAVSLAMSGRPGPVLIVLPENILRGPTAPLQCTAPGNDVPASAVAEQHSVNDAAKAIAAASRPLLIVGKGMRWAGSLERLHQLVDEFDLPFLTSPEGAGFLSEEHALCLNAVAGQAQEQADLIMVLGARLNWVFRYGKHFNAEATVIQVDIHEPEIGLNVTPTIGICADAGSFLKLLFNELRQTPKGQATVERDT
ncbi:MAG: thiamine pyrophosphate-binding protein, partial [Gammaproteobacteria bacterium]